MYDYDSSDFVLCLLFPLLLVGLLVTCIAVGANDTASKAREWGKGNGIHMDNISCGSDEHEDGFVPCSGWVPKDNGSRHERIDLECPSFDGKCRLVAPEAEALVE